MLQAQERKVELGPPAKQEQLVPSLLGLVPVRVLVREPVPVLEPLFAPVLVQAPVRASAPVAPPRASETCHVPQSLG